MPTATCPDCNGQGGITNDNTGKRHACSTCSGTGRVRTPEAPPPEPSKAIPGGRGAVPQ